MTRVFARTPRCYRSCMSQQRRSRMKRTRTGRRIELTARDIEIFKLLTRYRYLRSTYIHAFVGGTSETRFRERLGDLFHEGYLDRPARQWEFADARCKPVVHELGAGGSLVLRECGEDDDQAWTLLSRVAHRHFGHSVMICETIASLELGVRQNEALRFVGWPEILARAPETTRASGTPYRLPVPSGGYLVADGVFGIEYRSSSIRTYRFFALEADRGTMPVSRSNLAQTSLLGKFTAYRQIIASGVYKTYFGVPNLLVLTVMSDESRASEVMRKLDGSKGDNTAFLFAIGGPLELTKPMTRLLFDPWQRAGHEPLKIDG